MLARLTDIITGLLVAALVFCFIEIRDIRTSYGATSFAKTEVEFLLNKLNQKINALAQEVSKLKNEKVNTDSTS